MQKKIQDKEFLKMFNMYIAELLQTEWKFFNRPTFSSTSGTYK